VLLAWTIERMIMAWCGRVAVELLMLFVCHHGLALEAAIFESNTLPCKLTVLYSMYTNISYKMIPKNIFRQSVLVLQFALQINKKTPYIEDFM